MMVDDSFQHIQFDAQKQDGKVMPCLRLALRGAGKDDRIPVRIVYDLKKLPHSHELDDFLLQVDRMEKCHGLPRHAFEEARPNEDGEATTRLTHAGVRLFTAPPFIKRLEAR